MKHSEHPLVLAIDTATPCCSLAITRGIRLNGSVLGTFTFCGTVTHSRLLVTRIGQLMSETGTTWDCLQGIAVSTGPGSFTGLRIGMATAKGLAMAADRPVLGVSTMTCLASVASACSASRRICTVIDARKKEVYAAFFSTKGSKGPLQLMETAVLSPERLAEGIREPVYMIGDAVPVYGDYWRQHLADLYEAAPAHLHLPSAAALGMIAAEQLEKGEIPDAVAVQPFYVRASDAELNLAAGD